MFGSDQLAAFRLLFRLLYGPLVRRTVSATGTTCEFCPSALAGSGKSPGKVVAPRLRWLQERVYVTVQEQRYGYVRVFVPHPTASEHHVEEISRRGNRVSAERRRGRSGRRRRKLAAQRGSAPDAGSGLDGTP